MSKTEQRVHRAIGRIKRSKDVDALALSPDKSLVAELGLSSLDLAQLIAILQTESAYDPFAGAHSLAEARTVGDLVRLFAPGFDKADEQKG